MSAENEFDMNKINALPKFNAAHYLNSMEEVVALVHEISASDEDATIVSVLESAYSAATRIMEEKVRGA